jgi:hypothetical protein
MTSIPIANRAGKIGPPLVLSGLGNATLVAKPGDMSPEEFDAVMKVHQSLADLFRKNGSTLVRAGFVNGLPGFITLEADGELQTTALDIEGGKITAIYVVRNPDKLRHLH